MHLIVSVCHQDDVCENYIGSVSVGGYCGLNESRLCVFGKWCVVVFLNLEMFVGFVAIFNHVVY